jgi:hypothetical protein
MFRALGFFAVTLLFHGAVFASTSGVDPLDRATRLDLCKSVLAELKSRPASTLKILLKRMFSRKPPGAAAVGRQSQNPQLISLRHDQSLLRLKTPLEMGTSFLGFALGVTVVQVNPNSSPRIAIWIQNKALLESVRSNEGLMNQGWFEPADFERIFVLEDQRHDPVWILRDWKDRRAEIFDLRLVDMNRIRFTLFVHEFGPLGSRTTHGYQIELAGVDPAEALLPHRIGVKVISPTQALVDYHQD